jgi:ribonuclease HII
MIVGIDEAGRGPLCGPVVVCAYHFIERPLKGPIKDSKKLSFLKRQELFPLLLKKGIFSVALSTAQEIDRHNILEATQGAFNKAIKGIIKKAPFLKDALFIIDGPLFKTSLNIRYRCIKKADELVKEVASASILAKVFRDHLMGILDVLYPEWSFTRHKGYPTSGHRDVLKKLKLTPFHRESFCKNFF